MAKQNENHLNTKMVPIDRAGITELVVQRIKELLEQGDLKAGSRLPPERELADMLSISRPSLRTALKALSVMGIIRAKPGAGTYIAESLPEVFTEPMRFMTLINNTSDEEVFEARLIIEAGLGNWPPNARPLRICGRSPSKSKRCAKRWTTPNSSCATTCAFIRRLRAPPATG
ncbi:MAG: FadR family transcriptional regulator [Acidobacteria bacterium]|nr:FadR family transcriptional regulator [Acidobacteriota bacterium]